MNESAIHVDVAFVGGGVASLWLAGLAQSRGLSVVVIAPEPVGGEQTIASQGIIHGGAKYSLRGSANRAGQLTAMPARWRRCLAGNAVAASGDLDLSGVTVLAEHVELRACTRRARWRQRAAARLLTGEASTPALASGANRLPDFVVDVESLIARLVGGIEGRLLAEQVRPDQVRCVDQGVAGIDLTTNTVVAQRYVFAAGAGNDELAARLGFGADATTLRPLHQAWTVVQRFPPTFAHCLVRAFGTEPDLTVTTHEGGNKTVLYLGGHLATAGIARSADDQIEATKQVLARALPHLDLTHARFGTVRVARAEPARAAASRTDDAFLAARGNALLCFPVKLSLVPRLGDLFLAEVAGLKPVAPPRAGACVLQGGQDAPRQPVKLVRRPWA